MGLGCKLNMIRWCLPSLHSPSPSHSSSTSMRGKDLDFGLAKLPFLMINFDESEMVIKDSLRLHACSSSAIRTVENDYANLELMISKRSDKHLRNTVYDTQVPSDKDTSAFFRSVQACSSSYFHLLMENINMLENKFSDLDIVKLERDILLQLERLGALELFRACLSRTLEGSTITHMSNPKSQVPRYNQDNRNLDNDHIKVVQSKRKEERKSKQQKRLQAASKSCACRSETFVEEVMNTVVPSVAKKTKATRKRVEFAKNEAELAKGIKVVAKLEKVKVALEGDYGRAVTLRCWAEAAGIDEKMLQNDLRFGWYCRDELLKSGRSLVLYLARNYRGLGVAHEDLIQAGNIGILQGAERFDHTKGYQFSTYVQYWIRKAMSQLVSRHGRGIKVPLTLSTAINRIQKARKALKRSRGKHPDDVEVANFTGLSVDKIRAADKCLRIVGSLDQKVGNFIDMKYLECTSDTTIEIPEKTVMKQQMRNNIMKLLDELDPKERRILVLRYGFGSHCMSLHEIGKIFEVSKEWIRKIEKKAFSKLKDEEIQISLSHYLNL
ncbi:RNA polymerase sigma factor sigC isoform X2 [Silene latifolia]|uniref:RNA polymerase sigma factor sigC isoform X2 n=1 Tax=Silene latifolia TaxID=37657 RepID=UPI003D780E99